MPLRLLIALICLLAACAGPGRLPDIPPFLLTTSEPLASVIAPSAFLASGDPSDVNIAIFLLLQRTCTMRNLMRHLFVGSHITFVAVCAALWFAATAHAQGRNRRRTRWACAPY